MGFMKKKILLICIVVIMILSCKRSSNIEEIVDNIHLMTENIIFSFIDPEVITDVFVSFGFYNYMNNITSLDIKILFNHGYWDNIIIYNDEIEMKIIDDLFITFTNYNKMKNILKKENINVFRHYPFSIIFPLGHNYSRSDREYIDNMFWEDFNLTYSIEIYEGYFQGYINETVNLDDFEIFIKKHFGDDVFIILENIEGSH